MWVFPFYFIYTCVFDHNFLVGHCCLANNSMSSSDYCSTFYYFMWFSGWLAGLRVLYSLLLLFIYYELFFDLFNVSLSIYIYILLLLLLSSLSWCFAWSYIFLLVVAFKLIGCLWVLHLFYLSWIDLSLCYIFFFQTWWFARCFLHCYGLLFSLVFICFFFLHLYVGIPTLIFLFFFSTPFPYSLCL